jgi:putative thioredoxin
VNATDFEVNVIEASKDQPVLVDFWAPWCGPCRIIGPVLEKLASENEGKWRLVKVNTDESPSVASRYRISSIPAVKLFVDGEVVDEFVGALPEPRVRQWLDAALPSPYRALLADAEAALAAGDEAQAESLANTVLAGEPANAHAKLVLARALLFRNPARAAELAREAATAKVDLTAKTQAVEAVAGLLKQAGDPSSLPEGAGRDALAAGLSSLAARDLDAAARSFIESIRRDRNYDEGAARKAAVALFNMLGDQHPVTQRNRRDFQMAVF